MICGHHIRHRNLQSVLTRGGPLMAATRAALCETNENASPGKRFKSDPLAFEHPLLVQRLHDGAVLPRRGSAQAAGYDLASAEDCTVAAGGTALVKTGIAIAIPPQTYARIAPRSGLALKHSIATGAGVVDEDYRGEVGVVLFNHGKQDFVVKRGDRIAQMILEQIRTPEVKEVRDLSKTVRGSGGYGSTGS